MLTHNYQGKIQRSISQPLYECYFKEEGKTDLLFVETARVLKSTNNKLVETLERQVTYLKEQLSKKGARIKEMEEMIQKDVKMLKNTVLESERQY